MEEKTIWELIADALVDFDVYPPSTKEGECTSEYVVVKDDGTSQYRQTSSEVNYYSFLCYVPQEKYTRIHSFVKEVELAISKSLYPMLMPTNVKTPSFFDDSVNAFMISIQYRNLVKSI